LSELRDLSLHATQVTDAGLEHLAGLTQLTTLYLSDTHVTAAGVANLQQALPNCKITRFPPPVLDGRFDQRGGAKGGVRGLLMAKRKLWCRLPEGGIRPLGTD
jgi:hypothetical protein